MLNINDDEGAFWQTKQPSFEFLQIEQGYCFFLFAQMLLLLFMVENFHHYCLLCLLHTSSVSISLVVSVTSCSIDCSSSSLFHPYSQSLLNHHLADGR